MRLRTHPLLLGLALLSVGCARTEILFQSEPTHASVEVYNEFPGAASQQVARATTGATLMVGNEGDLFREGAGVAQISALISKQGHLTKAVTGVTIKRGELNEIPAVQLQPLDTEISITVDPPGADVFLYGDLASAQNDTLRRRISIIPGHYIDLPEQALAFVPRSGVRFRPVVLDRWVKVFGAKIRPSTATKVVAPYSVTLPRLVAQGTWGQVKAVRVSKDGYTSKIQEVSFVAGQKNHYSFKLRPMITTLQVIGDLKDVQVEDIRKHTGFGFLGTTPFLRKFTYDDTAARPEFIKRNKMVLELKLTKKGYVDSFRTVEIPLGSEKTVKASLEPRSKEITFQSDPPGAHVYVRRKKTLKVFDKKLDRVVERTTYFEKHLGTTPFTYYMDPKDPLEHDQVLIYKKSGYRSGRDKFVLGLNNYHKVLTPMVVKGR